MIKGPSRVPILPWESPLHLKESAPSLCLTSGSTGLNSYSAGTKLETSRPTASNPPPDSPSATTTKATTKNNIRTHPHPGLRPLPNKQKQRPSQPTGKTNQPAKLQEQRSPSFSTPPPDVKLSDEKPLGPVQWKRLRHKLSGSPATRAVHAARTASARPSCALLGAFESVELLEFQDRVEDLSLESLRLAGESE